MTDALIFLAIILTPGAIYFFVGVAALALEKLASFGKGK